MGRKRVAIIGSGLAGLTAAHSLASADDFEVELFERSDRLGLDASSVEVPLLDGQTFHLDTPMRAVQGGYYRSVLRLYDELVVRLKVAEFDYSFVRQRGESRSLEGEFIYEGGNGLRLRPLGFPAAIFKGSVTGQILRLARYIALCLLITLGYLQLVLLAGLHHAVRRRTPSSRLVGALVGEDETLGEWCRRWMIPGRLARDVVEPLFCCVCTCSRQEVRAYPAADILDYIWLTFGAKHYVCADGVASVVDALTSPLPPSSIHLGPSGTISRLARSKGRWALVSATGAETVVDHVVFATQANHALALLSACSPAHERDEALAAFEYCSTVVVNHFDSASVLPSSASDLRDLNIVLDAPAPLVANPAPKTASTPPPYEETPAAKGKGHVMATHVLTRTHPHLATSRPLLPSVEKQGGEVTLLQTTNPTVAIDRSQVVSETWFERAKVTAPSRRALDGFLLPRSSPRRGRFQGADGIWFCGSWAAEGIPLLEGCVVSAEAVANALRTEARP